MDQKCGRNRKRSQRRAIHCPRHGCLVDSVSQKHGVFADRPEQLQERGVNRKTAMLLMTNRTTVAQSSEWLEAFWCDECQATQWLHVRKVGERQYEVKATTAEIWQQVSGVIDPLGNPSVGEFTRRQSRMVGYGGVKDFRFTR